MGFYIRKGFNFGPLRLNLSRSGLGASFGVKGARIGVGPRGSYVQMGRGGLYYRQTLSSTRRGEFRPSPTPIRLTQQAPIPTEEFHEIVSATAVSLTDSTATDLLTELNRVKSRQDRFPIAVLLSISMLGVLWAFDLAWWWMALVGIATIILGLYARNSDVLNGTAILNYSLDSDAAAKFTSLQAPFKQLAACQRVWHIDSTARTSDWKRNAGVLTLLKRTEVRPSFSRPPKVQCNLELPTLKAGKTTLYFFPDRVLIYDAGGIGALAYSDLKVDAQISRFVEGESVPGDSQQVDSTWRYVNKKGGPDRRFNNNRQLPIMQYGMLEFSSASGLSALFMCSRIDVTTAFRASSQAIGKNEMGLQH
jgi:hypothetical protein